MKVLLHLGRLKERYRQAWQYVKISVEDLCLSWRWDRDALRLAASRDGAYLLRTNLEGSDPVRLWSQYIQLTEVEAVFRALKSDLAIRPIWHFTPKRVEAHVMVAFLGYCLWVCLKHKLKASAPSLTPWQLLDQFARIQMVEVWFKLRAGGCICLERITQPEAAQAALIHQLDWPLPQQPPAENLQDHDRKCVDNLRLLNRGSTERKPSERQKNAKVRLKLFDRSRIQADQSSWIRSSFFSSYEPGSTKG